MPDISLEPGAARNGADFGIKVWVEYRPFFMPLVPVTDTRPCSVMVTLRSPEPSNPRSQGSGDVPSIWRRGLGLLFPTLLRSTSTRTRGGAFEDAQGPPHPPPP